MIRMVHYNKDGFISGTTRIYENGEKSSPISIIMTLVSGVILMGFLYYVWYIFGGLLN
jgi:hypothetical protein